MLGLRDFIDSFDRQRSPETTDGDVARATIFGLDVAAVLLPCEVLAEERVERMNQLWDLLGEREALVIAASRANKGRRSVRSVSPSLPNADISRRELDVS